MPGAHPRYAVLALAFDYPYCPRGYVIYDCGTGRIVDGVYAIQATALDVAACYAVYGVPDDRAPYPEALGLAFPPRPHGRKAHA